MSKTSTSLFALLWIASVLGGCGKPEGPGVEVTKKKEDKNTPANDTIWRKKETKNGNESEKKIEEKEETGKTEEKKPEKLEGGTAEEKKTEGGNTGDTGSNNGNTGSTGSNTGNTGSNTGGSNTGNTGSNTGGSNTGNKPADSSNPKPSAVYGWTTAQDGNYPERTMSVGNFGVSKVGACRVKVANGDIVVGSLLPELGSCYFGYNGGGYASRVYEAFYLGADESKLSWIKAAKASIPGSAIKAGKVEQEDHYICKISFEDGDSLVGKMSPSKGCLYSINNQEYAVDSALVLTVK